MDLSSSGLLSYKKMKSLDAEPEEPHFDDQFGFPKKRKEKVPQRKVKPLE